MNKSSYILIILTWFLGNLSVHLISPALPMLVTELHTTARLAQFTISFFLLGKALSMLLWGTISERRGRKPIFIIGLFLYSIANFMAAMSGNIFSLLFERFIQGIAVGATLLMARTMINDSQNEQQATRQFALLFSLAGLLICFLPMLGSLLNSRFSWTGCFLFMAVYGVLLLLSSGGISETYKPSPPFISLGKSAALVFKNELFVRYLLISSLMMAGESAFNTSASFILIKSANYSLTSYGSIKTLMAIMHVVGTFTCSFLVKRFSSLKLIGMGVHLFAVSALTMWLFILGSFEVELTIVFPMMIYHFGTGFIVASTTAASVRPFPKHMATALACSLFCQFNISAFFSLVCSLFAIEEVIPFILLISIISFLGLLIWYRCQHTISRMATT